jgi:hypothetical protein
VAVPYYSGQSSDLAGWGVYEPGDYTGSFVQGSASVGLTVHVPVGEAFVPLTGGFYAGIASAPGTNDSGETGSWIPSNDPYSLLGEHSPTSVETGHYGGLGGTVTPGLSAEFSVQWQDYELKECYYVE